MFLFIYFFFKDICLTREKEKSIREIVVGKNVCYWDDKLNKYLWMEVTEVHKQKGRFGLNDFLFDGEIPRKGMTLYIKIFGSNGHLIKPCKPTVELQKERDVLVSLVKSITIVKRLKDDETRLEDSQRRLAVVRQELNLRSV